MNVSETVKRVAKLQLCGSDSRAQSYNEGLMAAIHIIESQEQPRLTEKQELLLEDLKDVKKYHKEKNNLGLIWVLGQRFTNKSDIKSFSNREILEVMFVLDRENKVIES